MARLITRVKELLQEIDNDTIAIDKLEKCLRDTKVGNNIRITVEQGKEKTDDLGTGMVTSITYVTTYNIEGGKERERMNFINFLKEEIRFFEKRISHNLALYDFLTRTPKNKKKILQSL